MIEKVEHMAMLFDFYGNLLTEKQQDILSLYYEQDLSLGEIAESYGVSRQAIHDILKRSEKILQGYEGKLGLVKKFNLEREKLAGILDILDNVSDETRLKQQIRKTINEIAEIQNE